jgi:hypothetical protein
MEGPKLKIDILISILTGYERHFWIHPDLFHACMRMQMQMQPRYVLGFSNIHGLTPVSAARNVAVEQMLDNGAQWLLQIDNDVAPPDGLLDALASIQDRKIVGFPCAGIHLGPNPHLCMSKKIDQLPVMPTTLPPGWSEMDAVGSGCLLVHRDVFLALSDPWFECTRKAELERRVYSGEDFGFCEKAKAKGFSVFTHSGFPCKHYRTMELMQSMFLVDEQLGKYRNALEKNLGRKVPSPLALAMDNFTERPEK